MKFMTEKQIEQLKADLKEQITAELKEQLTSEVINELKAKGLLSKAGFIIRRMPQSTFTYYVIQLDEGGNEVRTWGETGSEWYFDGAMEIRNQLSEAFKDGVLTNVQLHTNKYRGFTEPKEKLTGHFGIQ